MSSIPNLFLIGAMKSGTSSLHHYLGEHPDIYMSREKEPAYFAKEVNWSRGEQWYRSLFKDAGQATVIGESSTHYTKLPTYKGVSDRIVEFAPDAKFIYLMRDPVSRCLSQYWHHYQGRRKGEVERRNMLSAFMKDGRYIAYSYYAMQLKPYVDKFAKERILTLSLEEFKQCPEKQIRRIFAWLGVDDAYTPPSLHETRHATRGVVSRRVRWLHRFRNSRFWDTTSVVIPKPIRRFGAQLAEREPIDRSQVATIDAVSFLRPRLQEYTKELSDLLGRDFPEWETLWDTTDESDACENEVPVDVQQHD